MLRVYRIPLSRVRCIRRVTIPQRPGRRDFTAQGSVVHHNVHHTPTSPTITPDTTHTDSGISETPGTSRRSQINKQLEAEYRQNGATDHVFTFWKEMKAERLAPTRKVLNTVSFAAFLVIKEDVASEILDAHNGKGWC